MGTHALCVMKEDLMKVIASANTIRIVSGADDLNSITAALELINATADGDLEKYTRTTISPESISDECLVLGAGSFLSRLNMRFRLEPRKAEGDYDGCEQDPELFQIIPYTVITAVNSYAERFVLGYERGVKGDESRLHAKWSLGFGGHMEEEPEEEGGYFFVKELVKTACREIAEETGIMLLDQDLRDNFAENSHFIIENTEVGGVHLGICTIVEVPEGYLKQFSMGGTENISVEEGVVDHLTWHRVKSGLIFERNWEGWSQAVLLNDLV